MTVLLTTFAVALGAATLANCAGSPPMVLIGACFVALGFALMALAGALAYVAERALKRDAAARAAAASTIPAGRADADSAYASASASKTVRIPICNCEDCCAEAAQLIATRRAAAETYLAQGIAARNGQLTPADYGTAFDIARGNRPTGGTR